MNTVKFYYIIYIILTTFVVQKCYTQVTIGTGMPPISGALLQLKENEGMGANSTRGMMLPRVILTVLDDLSDLGAGLDKDEHIGLTVYSAEEAPCAVNYIYKGVYMWNGEKWQYIGRELAPGIGTFTDSRDGTIYRYRNFGATAGTWMLDDMRALTYTQGGSTPILSAESQPSPFTNKRFCYPAPSGNGTDNQYYLAQPAIAILYSWAAALNIDPGNGGISNPGATNQGEDGSTVLLKGPQGICPTGWHIPSDKEWNDLEEAIATEPEKYSTNSGTTWDPAWRTVSTVAWRPPLAVTAGHGCSMKSPRQPISNTSGRPSAGKSFSAGDGGFNILLVGDGFDGFMHNHGTEVSFWTASASGGGSGWARRFSWDTESILRVTNDRGRLFSVRCKMD